MVDTIRTRAELLTIFADSQPEGSINPQDVRDEVVTTDVISLSTGLIDGGIVTINAGDDTKIDITAGTGVFVDAHTDPLNPVRLRVSWSAFLAVDLPFLTNPVLPVTFLALNLSTGIAVIEQKFSFFTAAEHRDFVVLAIAVHTSNVFVESISPFYNFALDERQTLTDLATALFTINVKAGNVYGANTSANLQIDKSAGETFSLGGNYQNSKKSPNNTIDAVQSPVPTSILYTFQDGSGGFTFNAAQSVVDPAQFDDGSGVLQTVSPSSRFTTQRIWFFPGVGTTVIHYGQTLYNSLSEAEADINMEVFARNPQLDTGMRAWMLVRGDTTDLTDLSKVKFIAASMFGDVLRP